MFNPNTKDETMNEYKNAANAIKSEVREFGKDAKEEINDVRDAANKAGRKVRSYLNCAKDEVSSATETVTTQIRSNPVQSSMLALGAGFLIGSLFHRKA